MDKFIVTLDSSESQPSFYWGSILHGMLIEMLPEPYPEVLHENGLRPLSMFVYVKSETEFEWHIMSIDDDLTKAINAVLREGMILTSRNQQADWIVKKVEQQTTTVADYMANIFLAPEASRGVRVTLKTPATHKSNGRYLIFPSVDILAMNLRAHVCRMLPDLPFGDDQVINEILSHCYISRYELRSSTYNLEGHYVPGYYGRFEIHFQGPDPLRRLAETLFSFAAWCGIGAKTALGMGGCVIERLSEK